MGNPENKSALAAKYFYAFFWLLFVVYVATLHLRPFALSYIVKILPLISLFIASILSVGGKEKKFILMGIIFSAVGDVLLDIRGKGLFVFGLSSFAAAHIMYISAFFRNPDFSKTRLLFSSLFLLYGTVIWILLFPNLGKMFIPVTVYISIITLMGISSILGRDSRRLVVLGAVLFIASDSFIAINMFLSKIAHSSYWIMLTYFPAQFLIAFGTLKVGKAEIFIDSGTGR